MVEAAAINFEQVFVDVISNEYSMLPELETKKVLDEAFHEFERINQFNKNYLKNLDPATRFTHIKQLIRIFTNIILKKYNLDATFHNTIFSRLLAVYKEKYYK